MNTAVCPACVAIPNEKIEQIRTDIGALEISVPTIHCAACIQKIERGLNALDCVLNARVNLSLKRVSIRHNDNPNCEDIIMDTLANLGFDAHLLDDHKLNQNGDDVGRGLLMRLGIAGFAAMNVMLLSVSVWAGADGLTRDFLHWVSAAIALPTVAYTAQPFFKNAYAALRVGQLNMDVPISLAILMAAGLSIYETFHGGEHAYFDAALSLTFFLLAGRYLDHQTRARARSAATALSALEVPRAQQIKDGQITTVNVSDLAINDRVLVRKGARIPVDAVIVKGQSDLDVSLISGETMLATVTVDDQVYAGTLNVGAPLEILVTQTGAGTKLAEIMDLIQQGENLKTKYTRLADRAAGIYAPLVHLLALVAFVFWQFYSGDTRLAVGIATAVLIITCPCALGLAVPAVMTAASGRLFRSGVLIKDGAALERLAGVDTVVFDKTGTLTTGEFSVISAPKGEDLQIAASLAAQSDHPIAQAIVQYGPNQSLLSLDHIKDTAGKGVSGMYHGQIVKLGHADWVGAEPVPNHVQTWLRIGQNPPVPFLFDDMLKDSAEPAIDALQKSGLRVVLLSGDTQSATDRLAKKLGIDDARGGVQPREKLQMVQSLGEHVLMVGDGLNDTAALAGAHVSMAPARAIDAARTASDFVLIKDDLMLIPDCIALAQSAKRRMLENFAIAGAYNAVAIPIALIGLATPLLAALAMSASSICVSLNALRLTKG
ncbi:copper-translocating P-type ATPase [Amylibacter ulvae]|uniref:Copper-translocating P-type ATPase n=1 Tax=Paramylibacter ulvae TaxID=1651968 RepID=A0ABQ3CV98_9RHOB|nr:heavy metal translocating P-type ATPase [Amylibacter ulvae]GHA43428.1 copper-translocating P-type ATPase [Amylibacter ulvae]